VSAALLLGTLFFASAGTLRYWQAWVYLAVTFLPMVFAVRYLIRHDPVLLERRMQMRERREQQGAMQRYAAVLWLALFLIPGLDQRFGWSSVPWQLVVASDALVLAGYALFIRTMMENSFASRIIEVQEGQTVVTSGPYQWVRHPMYLAAAVMVSVSPLALGSFWALLPVAALPRYLVLRIRDEEAMLLSELPGYREYTQQTRYRLIPGLW
jgi:protein-S-isoprenylcysteine O-methyltransferase Ste14